MEILGSSIREAPVFERSCSWEEVSGEHLSAVGTVLGSKCPGRMCPGSNCPREQVSGCKCPGSKCPVTSETSFMNVLLYMAPKLDFKQVEESGYGKPKVRYSHFCQDRGLNIV